MLVVFCPLCSAATLGLVLVVALSTANLKHVAFCSSEKRDRGARPTPSRAGLGPWSLSMDKDASTLGKKGGPTSGPGQANVSACVEARARTAGAGGDKAARIRLGHTACRARLKFSRWLGQVLISNSRAALAASFLFTVGLLETSTTTTMTTTTTALPGASHSRAARCCAAAALRGAARRLIKSFKGRKPCRVAGLARPCLALARMRAMPAATPPRPA